MGKKRKRYPRDEVLYNRMQEDEIPLFFACIPGAVVAALDREDLWEGIGRPPTKLYDILICLLVKEYFGLSLRRTTGLLKLFKSLKLIDAEIPCFKTLDNYLNKAIIQKYLQKLVDLTSMLFSQVEHCIATDATGISTTCSSSWYNIRVCKKSKRKDHLMVHISIGTKSNVVVALDVCTKKGGDNVIFRSHVKRVDKHFDVDEWSGDKAYLSRENCNAVHEIGAEPWFKIKSNTTARARGSTAWKNMVNMSKEHPEIVDPKYHKRSNVESTNSAKKRKFGNSVRCRLPIAQKNEESFSWVGYNFSLVPRAIYEFGVSPSFIRMKPINTFYT